MTPQHPDSMFWKQWLPNTLTLCFENNDSPTPWLYVLKTMTPQHPDFVFWKQWLPNTLTLCFENNDSQYPDLFIRSIFVEVVPLLGRHFSTWISAHEKVGAIGYRISYTDKQMLQLMYFPHFSFRALNYKHLRNFSCNLFLPKKLKKKYCIVCYGAQDGHYMILVGPLRSQWLHPTEWILQLKLRLSFLALQRKRPMTGNARNEGIISRMTLKKEVWRATSWYLAPECMWDDRS